MEGFSSFIRRRQLHVFTAVLSSPSTSRHNSSIGIELDMNLDSPFNAPPSLLTPSPQCKNDSATLQRTIKSLQWIRLERSVYNLYSGLLDSSEAKFVKYQLDQELNLHSACWHGITWHDTMLFVELILFTVKLCCCRSRQYHTLLKEQQVPRASHFLS